MSFAADARRTAKALVYAVRGNPPALARSLRSIAARGGTAILSLHRVGPRDGSAYVPLSSELLDDLIGFCRRQGDIITLADYEEASAQKSDRPHFILSFDDGYRDFLDHALPILRRHDVRANHNFIPGCVDSGQPPLNVFLQDFIGKAPAALLKEIQVPGVGPIDPHADRERTGTRVSASLKSRPIAEQRAIVEQVRPIIERADNFVPTPMMNVADIAAIAGEIEIGAHSFDHATMEHENEDYVRDDARRCRSWFDERLGMTPTIYALPNGSGTDRQRDILRAEGFSTVLKVGERIAGPQDYEPNRITIYGDSRAEVRSRAVGCAAG